ncbi:hypothetical protein CLORY_30230 [Clostridium oryzae]|uniref:Radical SAM protein n=1 Tax=Clostridium oryzae TaxID=1450648 RepID=A0A1V4IJG7_9CLOT|nr:hypothetical protein CLORY_30230 [Clostridium oryzae]
MEKEFILSEYINQGVQNIVKGIVKASLKNPKETAFVTKYVITSKESKKKREKFLKIRKNVPAFLICSITSNCNLFCKGCYA